jgi:hypothetical protein
MRVLVAPVLVGDRICRIVSPIDSLVEVEQWMGEWWEPSSVTLTAASQSPRASEAVLSDRGVPPEDWHADGDAMTDAEIQSLLRASEPAAPAGRPSGPAIERRLPASRPREYPGNARFLRGQSSPRTSRD